MDTFIETVLQHQDLEIKHYKDVEGNSFYIGKSERYTPYEARSTTSALQCLFKFNMILQEQRLLATYIHASD